MARDSLTEVRNAGENARRLALALDAIEARLAALELGADADVIANALAGPIRAFDDAAKTALTGEAA